MLLQHLNDFANNRKLLNDMAFEPKAVRWIIPIDSNGNVVGKGPIETVGEKKNRGNVYPCPKTVGNKNAGGIGDFLADGITSLFGLESDPKTKRTPAQQEKRDKNNSDKFDDFWKKIHYAHNATQSRLLKAVKQFKPEQGKIPSFLEWGLSDNPSKNEKPVWWITTSSGERVKLGNDNFSFHVEGSLVWEDEDCIKPYWREVFRKEHHSLQDNLETGLCLITGDYEVPIERSHPEIKGVPGGQPSGSRLVSFEKSSPAFSSFGLKQGNNSPCSVEASKAYTEALRFMMSQENHSIKLGQTACCFWTQNETDGTSTWGTLLNQADPKAVADFLKSPWAGREREALRQEQFHAATLAGNSGRIVVRHWIQTTLETATRNLRCWFRDLDLEPVRLPTGKEKMPPLALFRLACTTVRDAKDLQTEVTSELFRTALEGTSPSLALLHPMLNRLRVDMARDGSTALLNHSRFALAKLILNRNRKENTMEITEQQDAKAEDAAYQCGRLLAVLAEAQAKAHDYQLEGAGVAERYFGTAMASPASVFPVLLKLNRHHLNNIRKSDKYKGHDRFLDEAIQEVSTKIYPFPRTLDLHAQGRFALGFYQQKAADRVAREAAKEKKESNQ